MSEFTMRLGDVLELEKYDERGPGVIGLATYPIFDESYRRALNEAIIRRYFMWEIGHETIVMFRHAMNREMHEIMPYYNKLYESEKLEIDPLNTVNLTTLATGEFDTKMDAKTVSDAEGVAESNADTASTSGAEALNMEYPQQQLNSEGRYATSGSKSESATNSKSEGTEKSTQTSNVDNENTGSGTNKNESTQKGWSGSQAEMLNAFRSTFINVDVMVLDSLQKLFMGVWSTGGSAFPDSSRYAWMGWGYHR